MDSQQHSQFKHLRFDGFRELARDSSLSCYEKIGFPDSYRAGHEARIFQDIRHKLGNLDKTRQVVMDVGPGCSELPRMLIQLCREREHSLILIDSEEMLEHLPDEPFIVKIPGRYPTDCQSSLAAYVGKVDAMLSYSVLHYVFVEDSIHGFLDTSLELLSHGGQFLVGDVPNLSKRMRFFSSPAGVRFHQEFMQTTTSPVVEWNKIQRGEIDDSVLLSLMMRSRASGCDSYLLPQAADLPMANRREDLLILRP